MAAQTGHRRSFRFYLFATIGAVALVAVAVVAFVTLEERSDRANQANTALAQEDTMIEAHRFDFEFAGYNESSPPDKYAFIEALSDTTNTPTENLFYIKTQYDDETLMTSMVISILSLWNATTKKHDKEEVERTTAAVYNAASSGSFAPYRLTRLNKANACDPRTYDFDCQPCSCSSHLDCSEGPYGTGRCFYDGMPARTFRLGFDRELTAAEAQFVIDAVLERTDTIRERWETVFEDLNRIELVLLDKWNVATDSYNVEKIDAITKVIREYLATGVFASLRLATFQYDWFDELSVCLPGHYSYDCIPCPCPSSLHCRDGTSGDGTCECRFGYVMVDEAQAEELEGFSIAGSCIALVQDDIVRSVQTGSTTPFELVMKNMGSKDATILRLFLNSADGGFDFYPEDYDFPAVLGSQKQMKVNIPFSPHKAGTYEATCVIYTDDTSSIAVALTGTGYGPDRLPPSRTVYRINSGSSKSVIVGGHVWAADTFARGGTMRNYSKKGNPLLQTQWIYEGTAAANGYQLPVPRPGTHIVTLLFAEMEANNAGQRLMNAVIEGEKQNDAPIDVFQEAGGKGKELQRVFTLETVADQIVDLALLPLPGFRPAAVSAIQVDYIPGSSTITPTVDTSNYGHALHLSSLFFYSMRSGKLEEPRRLAWRDDSCEDCIGQFGEDLSQAYYEAGGNYMKFGFHLAASLTQMAWNIEAFPDGHWAVNEHQESLDALRWGTDYLLNCHVDEFVFVGQLGSSVFDFSYYGNPEQYRKYVSTRPVFYVTKDHRASEIILESAAALAASSIVFRDPDPAYSQLLRKHAIQLHRFARRYPGSYMDTPRFEQHAQMYPSTGYTDEQAWAAIWLYKLTNEKVFLQEALDVYTADTTWSEWGGYAYSWDDKGPALHVLLSQVTPGDHQGLAESFFDQWLPGPDRSVPHTPKGLAYRDKWGSIRYAANTAFLALVHATNRDVAPARRDALQSYAKTQIDYALGSTGRSFVAGIGDNFPRFVYHKSSYNSMLYYPLAEESNEVQQRDFESGNRANTFTVYGAVVGGPIEAGKKPTDFWVEDRNSYVYSECALDYNAAFSGALAGLIEIYGGRPSTDCGLDLGWDRVPISERPTWPQDDCYHSCC